MLLWHVRIHLIAIFMQDKTSSSVHGLSYLISSKPHFCTNDSSAGLRTILSYFVDHTKLVYKPVSVLNLLYLSTCHLSVMNHFLKPHMLAVHLASLCADKAAPTPGQWHGRLCCCPSDVPYLTTITSVSEVGVTLYSAKDAVGLVINSSCIYFTQDLLDLYVYLWKHYGSLDPHDLAAVEVCKSCILLTKRILRAGLYNGQLLRGPHQALFSLEASDVMLNISANILI